MNSGDEEPKVLHPAKKIGAAHFSYWVIRACGVILACTWAASAYAGESERAGQGSDNPANRLSSPSTAAEPAGSDWHYGAYLDLSYVQNFNDPENHLWRSRSTASRHNELAPNMALVYVRKDATEASRWGMEFGLQGGYDSKDFAFLQGEKKIDGADTLRHLHRANASYLAPVGHGLLITAGLFNSLIGYESLYAKDNANYTRSWIADYSPYMMFGINAKYPVNERLTVAAFVINGYFHLSRPNDQPSYGAQWTYKATPRLTATQTIYWGPDQTQTALEYWRLYGNHIVEWKGDDVTIAGSYDIGTESIANRPGSPRTFAMGANITVRWHIAGPWSVAVRPEFYWDRNGRWTGSEQFVKAITSTAEYKFPYRWTNTMVRLEHRYDESTGVGGGFFRGGEITPGVIGLTPTQHLLLLSLLVTFDSP
jgi:hypothetical protein